MVAAGVLAARVVGDLVPLVARLGEQLLGEQVHVRHEVFVGHGVFAAADLRGKLGAVFDDERVRGNMVGFVGYRGTHAAFPLLQALPRRTVDEVHGHLQADLLGPGDDLRHVRRRVGAVEHLQHLGYDGLHAEGDAGKAAVLESLQVFAGHGVGVRFGGDFCAFDEAKDVDGCLQDAYEVAGGQFGGGAASEKDGVHGAFCDAGGFEGAGGEEDFCDGVVGVGAQADAVTEVFGGVGVEVAVAAAYGAEGDVHVEAEVASFASCRAGGGDAPVAGCGVAGGLGGHSVSWRWVYE